MPVKQEEMLRILTKGMVTIPKLWRDELGLREGEFIRAKRVAGTVILEPSQQQAPYRIYTKRQLRQFLKDDILPASITSSVDKKLQKTMKKG